MGATAGVLYAIKTVNDYVGQRKQADATAAQGTYEAGIDRQNAALADQEAADTITRGSIEEGQQRAGTAQQIGSQRASIGASGVDVGYGSALESQAATAGIGELDALMIRNNAAREAWGYTVQSAQDRQAALMAEFTGQQDAKAIRQQSVSTLITGGLNTFGMFQRAADTRTDQRRTENKPTPPTRPTSGTSSVRPTGRY